MASWGRAADDLNSESIMEIKDMSPHKPPLSRGGKTEFIRMVRYKSENQIGVLSEFVSAIAGQGGSIGDITTRKLGKFYIWRDVTIIANDREHFAHILKAIRALKKTTIEQIVDEVLERHQGGKIKMELNHPIETINDMRAVYTPGVADVCRLLQKDPSEAYNYTWIHHTVAFSYDVSLIFLCFLVVLSMYFAMLEIVFVNNKFSGVSSIFFHWVSLHE